jgi:hypothetical protein
MSLGQAMLVSRAAAGVRPTAWVEAAGAAAAGDLARAASLYDSIGSRPDAAFARLLSAAALREAGRAEEAGAEVERALSFVRRTRAERYARACDPAGSATPRPAAAGESPPPVPAPAPPGPL